MYTDVIKFDINVNILHKSALRTCELEELV